MKRILLTCTAIAALLAPPAEAAISVGAGGTGTLTFDTTPAATEWSTRITDGNGGAITTVTALDAAVQTNRASAVNETLPTSTTVPPSTNNRGRHNTAAFYLQCRVTGVSYANLMATLQNDTGSSKNQVTITYDQGTNDTTIVEQIPGLRVYYSLSGEPNTWQVIPELSTAAAGTLTATVSIGTWSAGSPLYLFWVDDNADPGTDGSYTIDNFSVTASSVVEEPEIVIITPTNNLVVPQSAPVTVTTSVRGAIASVDFYVDGSVVGSDVTSPFSFALDTLSIPVGSHILRARANVEGGTFVDTTNQNFTLTENNPPTIAITNVYSGTVTGNTFLVGSPVTFQTGVSDDVAVTNIEWYVDSTFYANRASTAPTLLYIDTLVGNHTIYAVAVDNSGLRTSTPEVPITITNPGPNITLLITNGSQWLYYDINLSQGVNYPPPADGFAGEWKNYFYPATDWNPLFAEIGGGDAAEYPEKSVIDIGPANGRYYAHYFRKSFNVADPSALQNLQIHLLRDDGAIVYLNGISVWTNNMGTTDPDPIQTSIIGYTNRANGSDDGVTFQVLNIIGASAIGSILQVGDNWVAVEVHQQNNTSSDTSFDLMLWGESAPPLPPVIIVTAPTNGQTYFVGDNVAVTATASTIFVTNVDFHLDGVLQANDATPPSPFTGTIPNVPVGTHLVTAVGQDTFGNVVTSDPVTIIVNPDQPPTVAISAVYNTGVTGTVFLVGSAVSNAVTATDDLGVTNVAFYLNGQFRAQDATSPYGPFIVNDALAGTNAFTAVAYDNKGQTNLTTVLVTITNPPYALILTNGSGWKYDDTGVAPPTDWMQLAFNDSGWSNGVAELGFGDIDAFNPERTLIRRTNELLGVATTNFYYRKTFTVADPSAYTNVIVSLLRDDGGQVYLNGALVFTSPTVFPPTGAAGDDGTVYFRGNVAPSSLVAGPNIVAVHVAQNNTTSSDTSFDLMIWGQSAAASAPPIHIENTGTQIRVSWTGSAVLQQADVLTVPPAPSGFSDVPGNPTSPYIINLPASGVKFFRLRTP